MDMQEMTEIYRKLGGQEEKIMEMTSTRT